MQSDKKREVLNQVNRLMDAYKGGELGGGVMPEDENPGLPKDSAENYTYFTLPMSLNYQRNSYAFSALALESGKVCR